ncbi:MAG: LL-diaminopimelate aminotransferase [bacterium]|nr:LL-diaminopimelate aminotransferase [bacterium]
MPVSKEFSNRLKALPEYLFVEIDRAKKEVQARGADVIDLGIVDPDLPTPDAIIRAMERGINNPANHQYPTNYGMIEFRREIAAWYARRFGVQLDPATEVLPILGSKEGIGHIPLAFVNPGDVVLVPDPGYPVYRAGTVIAGGDPYSMGLLEENGFLPVFDDIPSEIAKRARLMFINYPNNPTAAVASEEFFRQAVRFAETNDIIVCHDAAYSEMSYDGYVSPSFLAVEGAKEVGIEFNSLSKTFNMTGWRVGFAVGNAKILAGLAKVKSNVDSGMFQALQVAGIAALTEGLSEFRTRQMATYQRRRDLLCDGLNAMGWKIEKPKGGLCVWARLPGNVTSSAASMDCLRKAAVVITPGTGFGRYGEGYVRLSLTCPEERISEAVKRIGPVYSEWTKATS